MENVWKYKIDVSDRAVFSRIEEERNIVFPDQLKQFIVANNACTPTNYKFMLGNNEKVFGSVLSFNVGEKDMDSVFTAFSIIEDHNLLPFGIDPFGNYICYSIKNGQILFWDHETGETKEIKNSFKEFIDSLY